MIIFFAVEANGEKTRIEFIPGGTFGHLFDTISQQTGRKIQKICIGNRTFTPAESKDQPVGKEIEQQNGLNIHVFTRPPSEGTNALHQAAESATFSVMEKILRENPDVSIDEQDTSSRTPLYIAVVHKNQGAAQAILEGGANCDLPCSPAMLHCPMTPLYVAVCNNDLEMVERLLGMGADPNILCGWDKETALHFASSQGLVEMIRILTSSGADASIRNLQGKRPIDLLRTRWPIALSDEIAQSISCSE